MTNNPYRFRWTGSGPWGYVRYEGIDEDGSRLKLEILTRAEPYEHSHYNGTLEDYARMMLPLVGAIRLESDPTRRPTPELIAEFNRWRQHEHETQMAQIKAQPERYGEIDDAEFPAPPYASGAYLVFEPGYSFETNRSACHWEFVDEMSEAA